MLTEIISKTVADKTVDSILRRIERAVPVPTKRIALMGEVARVACRARLVGMECRVVVDEGARACNR